MKQSLLLGSSAVRAMAATASLTGLMLFSMPVLAQEAAAPAGDAAPTPGEEAIVVTASRVARPGYEAPTPTTTVGIDQLQKRGVSNIGDLLQTIPSFNGSATRSAGTVFNGGASVLNLRALGGTRTLVLVDGSRIVPSSNTGTFDLNLLPTVAIESSDVVTGGASAAYGSDAVAGVVNFKTRRTFTGLEAQVRSGISAYGDASDQTASLIWGTGSKDGRAHLVVAGEFQDDKGVGNQRNRDWSSLNKQLVVVNGVTRLLNYGNFTFARPGGLLLGPPTSFGPNTAFAANGTPYTANLGNPPGSGGDSPYGYFTNRLPLSAPLKRWNGFANLGYDFSDHFKATLGLLYGHTESVHPAVPYIGTPVVMPDNAYLAQTGVIITHPYALGIVGNGMDYVSDIRNDTFSARLKLEGDLGGGWSWDALGQFGANKNKLALVGDVIAANFAKATDAVRNGSGQIVCRVNQTTVTDAACVPFNLFGVNQFSQAAYDYVTGASRNDTLIHRTNFAANVRGNPFSTWAGKVSLAAGYEYRRDTIKNTVDAITATNGYDINRGSPVSGALSVHEVFGEVVVPLLADSIVKNLDFNGAVREAWYSPGKGVTTWKAGATMVVNSVLRFRGTISRDIRAPNISELFSGGGVGTAPVEPGVYNVAGQPALISSLTGGNLNLRPEIATTKSVGFAITPGRAHLSVDYYDIDLKGAIDTPGSLSSIVTGCGQGNAALCNLLTFSGGGFGTGVITQVDQRLVNLTQRRATGIDFDLGYRLPLGEGRVEFSLLGSYTIHRNENGIDYAGVAGGGYVRNSAFATPRWLVYGNIGYEAKSWGTLLNANFVSRSKTDPLATTTTDIATVGRVDVEHYAARIYFNLSAHADVNERFRLFGGINNLLDTDPPSALPWGTFGGQASAGYYDSIGRRFFIGARVKY
jgi:iron complex outermembrane recepter protein